jgi:transcriptional regulator with XRE-family HTH domain
VSNGWERLGQRIVAERAKRWRFQRDFAHATGLSTRVLSDLENGRRRRYHSETLAVIEERLGWAPGSCEQIVNGLEPTTAEVDPELGAIIDAWPRVPAELRRILADLTRYGQR